MIESLENNEVILMMYLAGELPPVDRNEVAQMLAADANLRQELELLRAMSESFEARLTAMDAAEPIVSEAVAVRRVGRAMRQHIADRAAEAAKNARPARSGMRLPWWSYPGIAAAAIFLAFIIWVINYRVEDHAIATGGSTTTNVSPDSNDPATSQPAIPELNPDPNGSLLAQEIEKSFGPSTEREDNQMFALRDDPQLVIGSDKNE